MKDAPFLLPADDDGFDPAKEACLFTQGGGETLHLVMPDRWREEAPDAGEFLVACLYAWLNMPDLCAFVVSEMIEHVKGLGEGNPTLQ